MAMPAVKPEAVVPIQRAGKVLAFSAKPIALQSRIVPLAGDIASRVVPPLIVLAVILLVWELLCSRQGASLPPPSTVLRSRSLRPA